ncbi:MAG: hypothetical protein ACXVZW_05315, partial [Gaiellaceae bacterium]
STGGAAATPWDALHSIDQGIAKAQVGGAGDGMVVTVLGGGTGYCLADFRGPHEGHVTGPGGTVTTTGAC